MPALAVAIWIAPLDPERLGQGGLQENGEFVCRGGARGVGEKQARTGDRQPVRESRASSRRGGERVAQAGGDRGMEMREQTIRKALLDSADAVQFEKHYGDPPPRSGEEPVPLPATPDSGEK